jgi:hypothetical protein
MSHFQDPRADEYCDEQKDLVAWFLNGAFLELRLLLEEKGLPQTLQLVAVDHQKAQEDFMKGDPNHWGLEPSSFWVNRLRQHVRAVDTSLGISAQSMVTRDLVEILRNAEYSITDTKCFSSRPQCERQVQDRMEAILKCVFRDLKREPLIGKPIKNFKPDTGLPSTRTLIEYKFVATTQDIARVADEVLADTRAYVSEDWDQFVFVVYETRRLRPEHAWNDHLRSCGVGDNTQIVVIHGEEPTGAVEKRETAPLEDG